jgi:ATP-dependent DNA helicase RecG
MYLEEITDAAPAENQEIECKSRLDRRNVIGWLKSFAGFANANGGTMYVGVEDKTNKLIGFDRTEADSERNYFNNQVNEHVSPRPPYQISFLRYEIRGQERFILAIRVESSQVKPVIVKFDGVPSIFMRREGFTGGATYEEIIAMSIHSQPASFDTVMSGEEYNSGDFETLRAFYRQHTGGKALSDKMLASLGFFNEKGLLANGAMLFRDHYAGHKTDVQCSVFSGLTKGSERIVSVNRFSGNITDSIDYMYSFVLQRMNHTLIKKSDSHIEIDAYPKRALFEGIINAVAHRDYFLDGTQIQVDMFRNRLEISSPGSFYHGEPLPKTYDLSKIISKRRNELICGILVQCGVMEAAGTGFDKIVEEYRDADDAHKPYIYSATDHFTLVLPDLSYTDGISNSLPALEFAPVPDGSRFDAEILSFCYGNARKAAEIAAHLGVSNSTHLKEKILGTLVANGYLTKEKVSRSFYYRTNPEMVRLK